MDYGTAWSKMVFRDYEAPGGERSHPVFENEATRLVGEFRFPSVVCESEGRFWFGSQALGKADSESVTLWSSIKIRMALPDSYCGAAIPLPSSWPPDDLATLTVVYLLQHARRQVDGYCAEQKCQARLGFTLGVPMSDMDNPELRTRFASVARMAWTVERDPATPDLRRGVGISEARGLLESAGKSLASAPPPDPRAWVRSEFEAALLWPFKSPDTRHGMYAAVDVGAGTTSASFFHINAEHHDGAWIKTGMAFFGATCLPPGGDAVDAELACVLAEPDPARLRGRENALIAEVGAGEAPKIIDQIFETYRSSFGRSYKKYKKQSGWEGFGLFLIGGGTEINLVRSRLREVPWVNLRERPEEMPVTQPDDLYLETVPPSQFKFLLVAYGLSYVGVDIPSVELPSEIPPLELRPARVFDFDRDNPDTFRPHYSG